MRWQGESSISAIHDLIAQVSDPRLRQRLAAEWANAAKQKKFGLVFEDHLPELLPLHGAKPRKGDLVCRKNGPLKDVWQVRSLYAGMATCTKPSNQAKPSEPTRAAAEPELMPVDDLLVVREFGQPIFPALVPVDAVGNGPTDAPWHTLIEADNYHALQLLDYLYAGQVDCIYIDPPYNTGARDWKYNNDYVDSNDSWRHSKWLAFMEKRLKLAKRLLKPDTGVLIVTIDEKEYLHLGMLLKQLFPFANIQMISSTINPKGTGRANEFLRVNEYIYFIWNQGTQIGSFEVEEQKGKKLAWETMRRRNLASIRGRKGKGACGPNQFYPIYVNLESGNIESIGEPLDENYPIEKAKKIRGCVTVFPIRPDGTEMNWSLSAEACIARHKSGYVRAGTYCPDDPQKYIIQFLPAGLIQAIETGLATEVSKEVNGSVEAVFNEAKNRTPSTQWNYKSHNAEHYGTNVLKEIVEGVQFPFPKSLYAIGDALKTFLSTKKEALIVDFFAGSGTTLNAVNLLNASDGGQRRCILVTNNEVSAEESANLSAQGLHPGDDEWEAQGICRSVTWPRSKYTILGQRDDGTVLTGEYLTGKTTEREKPRNFTHIGFVHPSTLNTHPKKKQVVALIDGLPQTLVHADSAFIVSEDHKATVLFDPAAAEDWLEALDGQTHITDFYIVTPTTREFQALKAQVVEMLGPLLVPEEEKRPMSEGFAANLAYFKLEFLEKDSIPLRRAFKELLPLLWLKAGAVGPRPALKRQEPEPYFLAPEANNFAVLLDESRLRAWLKHLAWRTGLAQVYIVTDSDEAFKSMAREVRNALSQRNPDVQVAQLYRDYLLNFMINTHQDHAGESKDAGSAQA